MLLLSWPEDLSKDTRFECSSQIASGAFAEIDDLIETLAMRRNHTDRVVDDLRTQFDRRDRGVRSLMEEPNEKTPSTDNDKTIVAEENRPSIREEHTASSDMMTTKVAYEISSSEREIALREYPAHSLALEAAVRDRNAAMLQRDAALRAQYATSAERSLLYADWQVAQAEIANLTARLSHAETALRSIESSTAWRMTWTLRRGMSGFAPAQIIARKAARAARWIARLRFERFRLNSPTSGRLRPAGKSAYFADLKHPVVLMIDGDYPRPDQDSGSIDALNFVKAFQLLGYNVVFVAIDAFSEKSDARDELERLGVRCDGSSSFASIEDLIREADGAVDVAFLSRVHAGGRYIETIGSASPSTKIIFNTVDLHHIREERQARLSGDPGLLEQSHRTRTRELEVARLADATIVVSDSERTLFDEIAPDASTYVVRPARDVSARVSPFRGRAGIGFIGGYPHLPNVDAVHYFLDAIWPMVREHLPGVEFRAMGANMPDELKSRTDPAYRAVGYVADLAEHMDALRLTVAPLRFGAGVKGKIVSSLSHGVPCVASSLGAEGMGLVDGVTVAIADTPDEFVRRIVEIYTDEQKWIQYSNNGAEFIKREYSFSSTKRQIEHIVSNM